MSRVILLCMTEKPIQILTEQMENLLTNGYQEFLNTLVSLSGNLKDIECGTHIKIPIPAGYVSCYKSDEALKLSLWISDEVYINLKEPEERLIKSKST